jgi:hypothetical protein
MSPITAGIVAMVLAGLLWLQALGLKHVPLRRIGFNLIGAGVFAIGLLRLATGLTTLPPLTNAVFALGVGLMLAGVFFLFRSWRAGELKGEVERYRQLAAEERERRERRQ